MAKPQMAKLKPELPPAEAIRALVDAEGRLALRVTPGARGQTLEIAGGHLLAKVREAPENGKASAAALALVAQALGIAPSRVHMLRGAASRDKLLRIAG